MSTDEEMRLAHAGTSIDDDDDDDGGDEDDGDPLTDGTAGLPNAPYTHVRTANDAAPPRIDPTPPPASPLPNTPPVSVASASPPLSAPRGPRRSKEEREAQKKAADKNGIRRGTQGGMAPAAGSGTWKNKDDLTLLWPEILQRLAEDNRYTPSDLRVAVFRITPPDPPYPVGHEFNAILASGSDTMSPVDALLGILTEFYHLKQPPGPATYQIRFNWKGTSLTLASANCYFPHQDYCAHRAPDASEQQRWVPRGDLSSLPGVPPRMQQQQQQPPPGYGPGYGGYPPPGYGGYPPPPYGASPYGAAPQPQQPQDASALPAGGMRDEIAMLRNELERARMQAEYTRAQLDAALKPPPPPPAPQVIVQPVPAPAPPPAVAQVAAPAAPAAAAPAAASGMSAEDTLVQRVSERILAHLGIRPGVPGVGVAGAPPTAPTTVKEDVFAGFETALQIVQRMKSFGPRIDKVFSGEVPDVTGVVEPSEADTVPFGVTPVSDVPWRDGRPVQIARDKKTGDIAWVESVMSNPVVAEGFIDAGNRVIGGTVDVLAKLAGLRPQAPAAAQPEVVASTPPGAQDASADSSWKR